MSALAKATIDEQVSELLDSPRMFDVSEAVIDYAPEDEFTATLRAMLLAYHNSFNAYKKVDREQSKLDFVVFAKSFSNVCLESCKMSISND